MPSDLQRVWPCASACQSLSPYIFLIKELHWYDLISRPSNNEASKLKVTEKHRKNSRSTNICQCLRAAYHVCIKLRCSSLGSVSVASDRRTDGIYAGLGRTDFCRLAKEKSSTKTAITIAAKIYRARGRTMVNLVYDTQTTLGGTRTGGKGRACART